MTSTSFLKKDKHIVAACGMKAKTMENRIENSIVHVVHCIDSEGPLYEPLRSTFERLEEIFEIDVEPTAKNLRLLQEQRIDLGGMESEVAKVVAPHLLAYNDTWDKIDDMNHAMLSPDFLESKTDSFGKPWQYNWFCMDFVDFEYNPRRRDMGYHNIHDHYVDLLPVYGLNNDSIFFHFHATPFNRQAHHCSSNFLSFSPALFQILARRIIDRNWFPSTYRAGCQTIRPDIHWFLEQYIPFDYSSLACADVDQEAQADCARGRFDDWRRTDLSWQPYHPSHDDYQMPGSCRRWISRCLNIRSRLSAIDQSEMDRAFVEAKEGKPVIVSISDHDFRDIRPDVDCFLKMLNTSSQKHPGVQYKFCNAVEAMRSALKLTEKQPVDCDMEIVKIGKHTHKLMISANNRIFGPQPFLAIKTKSGQYFHDNLDFENPFEKWSYIFDEMTFPLDAVETVGIAANDDFGNTTVVTKDCNSGHVSTTYLNKIDNSQ